MNNTGVLTEELKTLVQEIGKTVSITASCSSLLSMHALCVRELIKQHAVECTAHTVLYHRHICVS